MINGRPLTLMARVPQRGTTEDVQRRRNAVRAFCAVHTYYWKTSPAARMYSFLHRALFLFCLWLAAPKLSCVISVVLKALEAENDGS